MKKIMLSEFDRQCLERTIEIAKKTYEAGNYPVGAVLVVDDKMVDEGGNEIDLNKSQKTSFVNHAENLLIIRNGELLADAYKQNKKISLYSTLEPCIQCLGASVTNHVNRILFIEKDPNGGACDLKHDNIGVWYREIWPEIRHVPVSDEPKQLMIKFFHEKIEKGDTGWPEKMLKLLKAD